MPCGDWAPCLKELNRTAPCGVIVRIFWGDHETIQGVRDFHSKPRLKLEKVCSLAHSLQIPLHFRFGFNAENRSFPGWTRELSLQALVPLTTDDELIGQWEFLRVPSFRNEEVRKGFIDFMAEALSLLSLHRAPEGSLQSVSFDWGILRSDSCQMDPAFIERELTSRYGSIEKLNSLFQTNFNGFQSVSKVTGLKTILNKRPWLACWEYKTLKEKSFHFWEEEIKKIFEQSGFPWPASWGDIYSPSDVNSIVLDDTFLELSADQSGCNPLLVQGEMDSNALRVFRIAEMLKIEAVARGEKISWLSSWVPSEKSKVCVVVCSKFISQKAYSTLNGFIESGGKVYFPFGAPNWDENMESLQWKSTGPGAHTLGSTENLYDKLREFFV